MHKDAYFSVSLSTLSFVLLFVIAVLMSANRSEVLHHALVDFRGSLNLLGGSQTTLLL